MDITNVSSALSAVSEYSSGSPTSAVSVKMLDNALDMNEALNQDMIRMMELSVNPNVGSNFDMSV